MIAWHVTHSQTSLLKVRDGRILEGQTTLWILALWWCFYQTKSTVIKGRIHLMCAMILTFYGKTNLSANVIKGGQRIVVSIMASLPAAGGDGGWGTGCDRHDTSDAHPRDNSVCLAHLSAASHSPVRTGATSCTCLNNCTYMDYCKNTFFCAAVCHTYILMGHVSTKSK